MYGCVWWGGEGVQTDAYICITIDACNTKLLGIGSTWYTTPYIYIYIYKDIYNIYIHSFIRCQSGKPDATSVLLIHGSIG